jgi:hypothetical protein
VHLTYILRMQYQVQFKQTNPYRVICLLDLPLARILTDAKHIVVVPRCHRPGPCSITHPSTSLLLAEVHHTRRNKQAFDSIPIIPTHHGRTCGRCSARRRATSVMPPRARPHSISLQQTQSNVGDHRRGRASQGIGSVT